MPKKLEAKEGILFSQFLQDLDRKFSETEIAGKQAISTSDSLRWQIIRSLSEFVNQDICITKPQRKRIELLIKTVSSSIAGGEIFDQSISTIATYINSIRLDCHNCLNKECESRNPMAE